MIITGTIVFDEASPSTYVTSFDNQFTNVISKMILFISPVVFSTADLRLVLLQDRYVEVVVSVVVSDAITLADAVSIAVTLTVAVAVAVLVADVVAVAVAVDVTVNDTVTVSVTVIYAPTTTSTFDTTDLTFTETN